MQRDLFVFAGQSNTVGASVFPPLKKITIRNSFEYKHKARRLGNPFGDFVPAAHPAGEFTYVDIKTAYAPDMVNAHNESLLANYLENTFFIPSMCNLNRNEEKGLVPFATFSEATAPVAASLAPLLAEKWEDMGRSCAYAHIAKGCIPITYFFTDEMMAQYAQRLKSYNQANGTQYNAVSELDTEFRITGAADYFFEKCADFLADSESHFSGDTLQNKCFFWLQGEADAQDSVAEYEMKLDILWEHLKPLGFTHFFCIRIDFFGREGIVNIMKAQERFTARHPDAYMLTRVASYFTYAGRDEREWFVRTPDEECQFCRDSFYGYNNQHINEKGFSVIAEHSVKNLYRVLVEKKEPLLEAENIQLLVSDSKNDAC